MKTILLTIASLLMSSNAFAVDLSNLGSMTEYTCIVEVQTKKPLASSVSQTCNAEKTQVVDQFADKQQNIPQLQVEIISEMRVKGFHLVTQSVSPNWSGSDSEIISMIFQKRDIQ